MKMIIVVIIVVIGSLIYLGPTSNAQAPQSTAQTLQMEPTEPLPSAGGAIIDADNPPPGANQVQKVQKVNPRENEWYQDSKNQWCQGYFENKKCRENKPRGN